MYNNRKVLALISARKESKGLPNKNTKLLLSKPLIAWTIEDARDSRYVDRIVVSTEDRAIADISRKYGAEAPFYRPKRLAMDKTKYIDIVLHAIGWFEKKEGAVYDIIVILQPTCPLRTAGDIDKALALLFCKKAKAVVSVCEVEHPPYWANILPKDDCMRNFIKRGIVNKNRQELPLFYRVNGAVYVSYWDYLKKTKSFFGKDTFAYIMPKERSIDIDGRIDFKLAELLMKSKKGR